MNGEYENAIGCFFVPNGVGGCLVGFLQRHAIKHASFFNHKLAQVVEIHANLDDKEVCQKSYSMKGSAKAVML